MPADHLTAALDPADLADAVQTYQTAGLAALRVQFPSWSAAESSRPAG